MSVLNAVRNNPTIEGTYTVMTFGSRVGQFATETIPVVPGYEFSINYTATAVTITVWQAPKSLHFEGGSGASNPTFDYVSIPDNGSMDLGDTYSIEAWVYLDDTESNTIIDKGDYRYLFATHPNTTNGLGLYNPSMGWIYSAGTVPINEWAHVAVSFDAINDQVVFYLNGVVLSSHTGAVNGGQDDGDINVGRQVPTTCQCNNFNGKMDELRVWAKVLTPAEILANKDTELLGTEIGLAGYYQFNYGVAGKIH